MSDVAPIDTPQEKVDIEQTNDEPIPTNISLEKPVSFEIGTDEFSEMAEQREYSGINGTAKKAMKYLEEKWQNVKKYLSKKFDKDDKKDDSER